MRLPPLTWNAVILGIAVLSLAGLSWHGRRRARWAGAVALAAVSLGLYRGAIIPSDVWHLPEITGHLDDFVLLVGWGAFAVCARAAGGARLVGPAWLAAFVSGAVVGELAGAAVCASATSDRRTGARLALLAAAGGLLGRFGDPALLIAWERGALDPVLLGAAAVACAGVALVGPQRWPSTNDGGSWVITAVGVAAAVLALVPGWGLPVVWGAVFAAGAVSGQRLGIAKPGPLLYTLAAVAVALIAVAGGAPEVVAGLVEQSQDQMGAWASVVLAGGAALLALLVDGPAAGLLVMSALDRGLSIRVDGALDAVAIGAAVGGAGPLVVAGVLREGLWRLLIQVVIVVGLVGALI